MVRLIMAKRVFLVGGVLFLALLILLVSLFRFSGKSFGQDRANQPLPYPGILPDHPFYWLKMVRDRLWLWLTTDPEGKVSLYLLFADKRLAAGMKLIEKKKPALALTTISKGEKYLERAHLMFVRKKVNNPSLKEKLKETAEKHQELLLFLEKKLKKKEEKGAVKSLIRYPETILEKGIF